jgi:hypothetical protein
VAALLRRELNTEVELVHGRYGEFKVLVNDATVIDGGALAFLGVLPSRQEVVDAVRARLSKPDNLVG